MHRGRTSTHDAAPPRPLGLPGLRGGAGHGQIWGRNTAVRYPRAFALPDDAAVDRLLGTARELGINLLDTAPAYGSSEERLCCWLRGRRQDWVLCTKCGEEFDGERSRFDFSPAHTRASVERSLQRLGTDYLDIVLLHSDGDDLAILESSGALETLIELRREGLVRACGISAKTLPVHSPRHAAATWRCSPTTARTPRWRPRSRPAPRTAARCWSRRPSAAGTCAPRPRDCARTSRRSTPHRESPRW